MILVRQPIPLEKSEAWARGQLVEVKGFQMTVYASLTKRKTPLEAGAPRFPMIIDTGNTGTFAIRGSQLESWTRLDLQRGNADVRIGGATARKYEADLWIHGVHGPYPLDMKGGIIVYPNDDNPARLPILGLRAIVQNELTLTVDGKGRMVVLKAPGWPWF